jgi:FixJ family two-component response regulator
LRKRDLAIPAILVTTHPDATVRKMANEAGVPIVEKPFLENALVDHLVAAIGTHYRPAR